MEQNQGREGWTSRLVELILIERLDWHHQIFFKKQVNISRPRIQNSFTLEGLMKKRLLADVLRTYDAVVDESSWRLHFSWARNKVCEPEYWAAKLRIHSPAFRRGGQFDSARCQVKQSIGSIDLATHHPIGCRTQHSTPPLALASSSCRHFHLPWLPDLCWSVFA